MAQHDFAPAWLNFPTPPSSTKNSLNPEKQSESLVRPDSRYHVIRRRHNSSDAFDAALGRSSGVESAEFGLSIRSRELYGRTESSNAESHKASRLFSSGNFGRKEKNGWRSQGRNGSENINVSSSFNGTGSRSRSSTFHGGKSHGHREGSYSENDVTRRDDRDRRKQFEAEDFPSLNPEHEKELNQNKSPPSGVWEYPLNTKSRTSRMLVIRKGMKDDFSLCGYPIAASTRCSPGKSGTEIPKGLTSKESSPTKEHGYLQLEVNTLATTFCLDSSHDGFGTNNCGTSDFLDVSQTSVEEEVDASSFHNIISTCHEGDINLNFEQSEIPQGNGNSFTSRHITESSTFPQEDVLSSSLEAEHRLLKEMGWQEDSENDETYAPLTEAEMKEFQAISEQLQKNGLRKNGFLRNGLFDVKFDPWKYSTFTSTDDIEDTETSSSDTSDDDDL